MQRISPNVWMWSETHGEARGEPYPWNSFVIRVPQHKVLALIDPLPASDADVREIETIGKPTHIVLTCEYHLRSTDWFKKRYGCLVLANEVEIDRYEVAPDCAFRSGESLWQLIDLVFIPHASYPETALLVKESGGVLIVGDLLSGERLDKGIPKGGLGIFGPQFIVDLQKTRASLRGLLDYSFQIMCFGHGHPLTGHPKEALRSYLDNDDAWEDLQRLQIERQEHGTEVGLSGYLR
ncbi:hypothetical protein IH992_10025 [Candidatus Poribacteria bacterium]|nr:hypothetical protein [Candidatus Poribacteria bacterium]